MIARHRIEVDQRRMITQINRFGEKIVVAVSLLTTQQYRNVEQAYGSELMAKLFDVMDRFLDSERPPISPVTLPSIAEMDADIVRLIK